MRRAAAGASGARRSSARSRRARAPSWWCTRTIPPAPIVQADERAWLEALCARRGLPLIADEVFLDYGRGAACETSFATTQGALAFALSGLSKLAGLPQLKLGWIALAGPEPRATARRASGSSSSPTPTSPSAPPCSTRPRALLALRSAACSSRSARAWPRTKAGCASAARGAPRLPRARARGRLVRRARARARRSTRRRSASRCSNEHGVLVHPGFFFDFERPGVLVVSLLARPDELAEGIARVIECANSM